MKKTTISLTVFMIVILFSITSFSQDAQIWNKYIGTISDPDIPVLPNYGYAGYKQGQEAIPDSQNLMTFDVTNYGAVANDSNSDQAAIQAAIDAAEANGGGIVFFPSGEFLINTNASSTSSITITGSNIILKGSGSTPGGTVINMVNHMLLPNGQSPWNTPQMIQFIGGSSNTGGTNIAQDQNRGDFTVKVENASIFQNKKYLKLEMNSNVAANSYFLDGKTPRDIWTNVINDGVKVSEFHEIESIDILNNIVTLKDPILDDIDFTLGWKAHTVSLIENCGFEDIHFKGNFNDPFQHHKDYIHDYAWHAILIRNAANSWVRRSKFSNVSMTAKFHAVYASTLMNILVDGNAGHAVSTADGGSTRVLQGLIWDNTNNGQWHGTDMSGRTSGSVVWRVESAARGWDLHSAQPRTNLIDLYSSDGLSGSGGHYSNNPNHLSGLTIWNQERTGGDEANYNFWNTSCGGNYCGTTVVNPIIVGYHGSASTTFDQSNVKYEESNGVKVSPESLYEAQVEHRLGSKPAWIDAAITKYESLKTEWYEGQSAGNGSETFTNMTLSGWGTETYTGDNGISWTVNGKGVTGHINSSKGIYFQKNTTGIQSGVISGGIGSFSVSCKDLWEDGVERTLQLLINDNVVDTFKHTGTSIYTYSVDDINISGDITIAIKNASIDGGGRTVAFDDITWTGYSSQEIIDVTGISTSPDTVTLTYEGETSNLSATIYPSIATNKTVTWESDDELVATVDQNTGVVTAVANGNAIITATTEDGGFTDTSNIIVDIAEGTSGGSETFTKMTLSGWGTETYIGDNGISWTVTAKGVNGFINSSQGVYFQKNVIGIQSGTISGGIATFSVSCKDLWEGGIERKLQLLINGNVVDTFTHTGDSEYTYTVDDINISGDITLAIKNASSEGGNRTVAFDDITWTGYDNSLGVNSSNNDLEKKVILYPNPVTNEHFTINLHGYTSNVSISIFDTLGRLMYKENTNENMLNINSNIFDSKGLYFLKIQSENNNQELKIIVR